jgi:hypothetical protein
VKVILHGVPDTVDQVEQALIIQVCDLQLRSHIVKNALLIVIEIKNPVPVKPNPYKYSQHFVYDQIWDHE